MGKRISEKVTWVGKIDWQLRRFHGDELSTDKGTSYNSYLVRDEKVALIDTVWQPFDTEFVARLKEEIDLNQIDYIIMQHNEIDHSGALPELMREIPNTPIYCTAAGESIIRGHYHQDWNFVNVKTGDTLSLGTCTLTFVEAAMLHWPDTMFSYLSGENILFSNDGFGQHYATESLFNDTVNTSDMMYEAEKYYANILNLYSGFAKDKIEELLSMNLQIDMICPSHGVIWKDNPLQIVEQYTKWANAYQENQITILYDSMWNSTRTMAESLADGIQKEDPEVRVKLFNVAHTDKNDLITEVFHSKAILTGCPTINYGISFAMAGVLEMIKGCRFINKKAAAFGSFGWSGGSVKIMNEFLAESGFELVNDGYAVKWVPDQEAIDACRDFGSAFVKSLSSVGEASDGENSDSESCYACDVCGYVYEGDDFEALPVDYRCPVCKVPKSRFVKTAIVSEEAPAEKRGVYVCNTCGFVYDPVAEGTPWEELPDSWKCPVCGVSKDNFTEK